MITYGSTTLTSYNTITKIEVYYYKSTSATSLSGGSWSTTKPTWENGKYIWQKIRTTYEGKLENGQYYSESDPVNITGQQGATGTAAYSYKLNASDTTVTISKIGVYSVNKITFTATSKQGTGNVVPYAGQFKIETTINGTTWTTSYTSSGNESSKEFTIPTGIIAIRCSLYQANGITTLLDIITIPILSDDRPIVTKTYTGLIGSANDAAGASFYFAKIHPDSYTTNYKVKMKVRVTAPEAYAETIDIQFGGYGSTFSSYDSYTTRTGNVGVYYINLYRATQVGISTNHKGHALGIGLRNSSNPTNTSYKRTIIVDILELDGCTIKMLDTAVKYANIDGTGTTNYYGLTEMAVGTTGQNATNNTNTHYTQYSNNVKAGTNGIKGYTLIMKDSENTWSCFYSGAYKVANTGKTAYTGGFMLGKILYSAGAGAQTSDSSLDTYYNYKSGVNTSTIYDAYPVDFRYSTNCASTLTSQRPVYIVGTIESDGLFHLDVSQWYTQAEPTYADGKVYVYVGIAYSAYQVWLSTENPAYVYYNNEFILYDKAQTLQNIASLKDSLETQIDSKVETWCQKTNPASSWTAEERPNHTGDLWYYIGESGTTYKNNTTYQYNGSTNTWSAYSANPDLFDKIDGKTAIYYGTQSSVTSAEEGDYLVDSTDGSSYRWNSGAWVKVTDYKTAINNIQIGGRNLLCNSNQSLTTVSSKVDFYLSETIPTGTTVIASVQIDADDIVWETTNRCRIGFEMSQSSDGIATGTQYVGVWWGKSGTTNNGAGINYNTSSTGATSYHGRIWSKVTLTRPFLADIPRGGIYVQGITSGTYKISNPKVEIATKPSDWTPAPEDLDVTIGARNLLLDSRDVRTSQVSAKGSAYILPSFILSDYGNSILNTDDYYTYSFDYEVTGNTAENAFIYVQIKGSSVPSGSKGYFSYVYNTPSGKYVCTFKINDTQVSATTLACGIRLRLATDGATFIVKNVKLEKGNRATDWTPAPEDIENLTTAVYGTCSTAATTPLKEIVCENFILFDGVRIQVAFENANSANVPSINVNNTGAKQILINQAIASESNQLLWAENAQMEFVYDGTYWVLQNAPYSLYGICSVTEEIPVKVIECAEAVICKGTTITVDFMYSNTSDNTVFNVANIAQKPLLINGDVLKVNSRFNWHAGAIRTFYFDGQAWNMSDDIVSAYIDEYETEQNEDGIMVHPVGQKNTGWSIGSTLELLKNGVSYIKMWFDKVEEGEFSLPFIRIGKESGNHVLVGDDAVTIREDQKELAHYSSLGITFDDETPYKIGNDTTYIAFEDTDNDAKADSLRIVADSISFHSNGAEKDLRSELEGLNENIDLNAQAIEQNAEAIENTQKYIQIDPEVPSIKLATNDRNYLLIESNKLGFWVDANETAYMSQNQMNIPTASITNLLMQTTNAETGETIGQIGWVMRTNGHLSLKIMN